MTTIRTELQELADGERILRWFAFDHLPAPLAEVSSNFAGLAMKIVKSTERSPERTVALRKLLESKDAAVRATLDVSA